MTNREEIINEWNRAIQDGLIRKIGAGFIAALGSAGILPTDPRLLNLQYPEGYTSFGRLDLTPAELNFFNYKKTTPEWFDKLLSFLDNPTPILDRFAKRGYTIKWASAGSLLYLQSIGLVKCTKPQTWQRFPDMVNSLPVIGSKCGGFFGKNSLLRYFSIDQWNNWICQDEQFTWFGPKAAAEYVSELPIDAISSIGAENIKEYLQNCRREFLKDSLAVVENHYGYKVSIPEKAEIARKLYDIQLNLKLFETNNPSENQKEMWRGDVVILQDFQNKLIDDIRRITETTIAEIPRVI